MIQIVANEYPTRRAPGGIDMSPKASKAQPPNRRSRRVESGHARLRSHASRLRES
jgi:hypothetical protein